MEPSIPQPTPADAVRALFAACGRGWETHDRLLADLAIRCRLDPRAAQRALDRLLAEGGLDAITLCHCPAGAERMLVESAYQPGPRLRSPRCGEVA